MGRRVADVLRSMHAPGARIHHLRELGLSGVADEVWIPAMANHNVQVVVTLDSSILQATLRRDVWRAAGLSLFVMSGDWGNLKLFEKVRMLIWWWPAIVAQAETGPQGGAWQVPLEVRTMPLRQIFADPETAIEVDRSTMATDQK
jgi:hypothetical protein